MEVSLLLSSVALELKKNLVSPQKHSIEVSEEILIEGRKKLYDTLEIIRQVIFYEASTNCSIDENGGLERSLATIYENLF